MPFASPKTPGQKYLRRFDRMLSTALEQKKNELHLFSINRLSEGTWRLNYDETLSALVVLTTANEPGTQHSRYTSLEISVAFQKMAETQWRPWVGVFGAGSLISTDTVTYSPRSAVHAVVTKLSQETQRPEIRRAVRIADAYDRVYGQAPRR